jgi:hypothetical protein
MGGASINYMFSSFFLYDDIQVSAILLQLIVQMYSSYYESV